MEQLLLQLLQRLEVIGERDGSLFDSEVREQMGMAVFLSFIKPQPGYVLPDDYGMSPAYNQEIKEALSAYIKGAIELAPKVGIDTFHKRLEAFQNREVRTQGGKRWNDSEEFFGWSDPEQFDENGDVIPHSSGRRPETT